MKLYASRKLPMARAMTAPNPPRTRIGFLSPIFLQTTRPTRCRLLLLNVKVRLFSGYVVIIVLISLELVEDRSCILTILQYTSIMLTNISYPSIPPMGRKEDLITIIARKFAIFQLYIKCDFILFLYCMYSFAIV